MESHRKQAFHCRYYTSMLPSSSLSVSMLLLQLLLVAWFSKGGMADLRADEEALLGFFNGLQGASRQLNWSNSTSPCSWMGVQCSPQRDNVIALKLPGTGLHGTIPVGTLGSLSRLQILSLRLNHLFGPLPQDLLNCTQLKKLFLQSNLFSGSLLPFNAISNPELSVVDASFNRFTGNIPSSFSSLPHLKILLLQNNSLSGSIPLSLGSLSQFNVSNNKLSGSIPAALQTFSNSSYADNVGLCGPPLLSPCPNPTIAPSSPSTLPSSPPSVTAPVRSSEQNNHRRRSLSTSAIVLIVIADVAFLFFLSALCMLWYSRKNASKPEASADKAKKGAKERGFAKAVREAEDGKEGYSSAQEPEHNRLVFFHGRQLTFDLEDLLRASAEVLGKGAFGTSYKAVLEDGPTVVVKRLKEASVGRKEFEQHMDGVGKMRHRNLVPLRAYYYSKEEKLLVHEFLPLGSVAAAIHGRKTSGEPALDWKARLKIAAGAARGLEYLHATNNKSVHGDIKLSNILLYREFEACISDHGLAPLFWAAANNAMAVASQTAGYRAPEVAKTRKLTQKSDVYSFGVVLLELLTGKAPAQTSAEQGMDLPKWVQSVVREEWTSEVFDDELMKFSDIEEEMVQLLQIALACVSSSPDQRPTMGEVLKMVQDVRHVSDPNAADDEEGRSSPAMSTRSSTPQDVSARASPPPVAEAMADMSSSRSSPPVAEAMADMSSSRSSPAINHTEIRSPDLIDATREAKLESRRSTDMASDANTASSSPITSPAEDSTNPVTNA